ncbi:MAG: polysaccharide pyruvyl transferase family protein [Culicoidibacterales bacterium]
MKKIFVDIYLAFNLGDDLFLDLLTQKYPNAEITVNYVGSGYDQFISKYNNVKRREYTLLNKIQQKLKIADHLNNYETIAKNYDALVFIGGSIFREESYHETLYAERLNMIQEFKKKDKPVFILGANFGPFTSEKFYQDYRELYSLCDDICFRDKYSYKLFEDMKNVRYAPDLIFQYDISNYKKLNTSERVATYSIIDVRHKDGLESYYDAYIESTIESIEKMVQQGYKCQLMSFCEAEGDWKICDEINKKLSSQTQGKTTIYNYKGNVEESLELLRNSSIIFAARFHANILGLLLNIPVVPIIYSSKTKNMLADIDKNYEIIEMTQLTKQYDTDIIDKIQNTKVELDSIKKQAKEQFAKLDCFVNEE